MVRTRPPGLRRRGVPLRNGSHEPVGAQASKQLRTLAGSWVAARLVKEVPHGLLGIQVENEGPLKVREGARPRLWVLGHTIRLPPTAGLWCEGIGLPEETTTMEAPAVTDFPSAETELTHILVVSDLAGSREWYERILRARLHRQYGGTSAVFDFNGAWILLVTGGAPTADKPGISLRPLTTPRSSVTPSPFEYPTANGHMRS